MQTNLAQSLTYITDDEGPELNVSPDEPGGASKCGVTLTDLSEVRGKVCTVDDVGALTQDDANQIYSTRFAVPIHFNDLPAGVDYRMLDCAVTLGITGSIEVLQMALGMWPLTGAMDAPTLAALKNNETQTLEECMIYALSTAWIVSKRAEGGVEGWTKYGKGWSARNTRATNRATNMIVGAT